MNQLPDIILIDFCEWLKQQIEIKHTVGSISFIFKERNVKLLEHCAKLYLDSYENDELQNKNKASAIVPKINASEMIECLIEMFSREPSKEDMLLDDNNNPCQNNAHINPDLTVEAEFLEWLISKYEQPINLENLSIREFNRLANYFRVECQKNENDIHKLIFSFKYTHQYVLADKFLGNIQQKTLNIAKEFGYVWGRGYNRSAKFRCLIIPNKKDGLAFIDAFENSWEHLHNTSGDYLNILFSKADYTKSSSQALNQIHYIYDDLKKLDPAVIIWDEKIVTAQRICISNLDVNKLSMVIECIINEIRDNKNLDRIVAVTNALIRKIHQTNHK